MVNKKERYLFLVPVVILIIFSLFFANLSEEQSGELLNQRVTGMQREVDLVAGSVSHFVNQTGGWDAALPQNAAYLKDALIKISSMYGAVYDQNFAVVAEQSLYDYIRQDGGKPFDPRGSETFMALTQASESGLLALPYDYDNKTESITLYFKWMPSGNHAAGRLLICTGVMQSSVQSPPGNTLKSASTGMIIMIFVTFLLNVILIELITRFSKICRSDPK